MRSGGRIGMGMPVHPTQMTAEDFHVNPIDPSSPLGASDNPISAFHTPPLSYFGGTYQLVGAGQEINVIRAFYNRARAMTLYVGIDTTLNSAFATNNTIFAGVGNPAHILARLRHGMHGTIINSFFDVPFGQIIQIPLIAESVDVSCYAFLSSNFAGASSGAQPPPNVGTPITDPTGNPLPLSISGYIGEEYAGVSNATRQYSGQIAAGATQVIIPPVFGNYFRVLGGPGLSLTYNQFIDNSLTIGPFNVPDLVDQPVLENMSQLQIHNGGGGAVDVVAVFKLGYKGDVA